MAIGGLNAFLTTSYTTSDKDITAADLEYTRLEAELEYDLLNIERDYPGFDEYRYRLDPIGHDPHELMAYLTARFKDFTYAEVETELRSLFSSMYTLSITETVEVRYRTETRYRTYTVTDPETGEIQTIRESYEVEVPYNFYMLNINLSSTIDVKNPVINSPDTAATFFHSVMDQVHDKEAFVVAFLNTKNRVIDHEVVSLGTINSSIVHPRELFRNAIVNKANAVILCHNHPSGALLPARRTSIPPIA